MTQKKFNKILKEHEKWLNNEGGKCADLTHADLHNIDLYNINLNYADLHGADLHNADLKNASLDGVNLNYADLRNANLSYTNLRNAQLYNADLNNANLSYSNLQYAYLTRANLHYADLCHANLQDASLIDTDLYGADLHNANLYDADLLDANLANTSSNKAKNFVNMYKTDLYLLKFQTGKLRAFKYVDSKGKSPYQQHTYEIGKTYKETKYDKNENNLCGRGLNVATLDWCLKDTKFNITHYKYFIVEFDVKDIIAIPYFSDGKFRVKKFKVIKKLTKRELKQYVK